MWTNGSRSVSSTPANARRTGNPSPSKPPGAVTTAAHGADRRGLLHSGEPLQLGDVVDGDRGHVFLRTRWRGEPIPSAASADRRGHAARRRVMAVEGSGVYRTESGMIFRVSEDADGHLSVGILEDASVGRGAGRGRRPPRGLPRPSASRRSRSSASPGVARSSVRRSPGGGRSPSATRSPRPSPRAGPARSARLPGRAVAGCGRDAAPPPPAAFFAFTSLRCRFPNVSGMVVSSSSHLQLTLPRSRVCPCGRRRRASALPRMIGSGSESRLCPQRSIVVAIDLLVVLWTVAWLVLGIAVGTLRRATRSASATAWRTRGARSGERATPSISCRTCRSWAKGSRPSRRRSRGSGARRCRTDARVEDDVDSLALLIGAGLAAGTDASDPRPVGAAARVA